jgi:hypothetical protein
LSALQTVVTVLGIVAAILGIIGGLLSLPSTIRKFQRERRPHGSKGMGFLGWTADRQRFQTRLDEANTQLDRAHQQLNRVARLVAERETEIAYLNHVAKKSRR